MFRKVAVQELEDYCVIVMHLLSSFLHVQRKIEEQIIKRSLNKVTIAVNQWPFLGI